MVSSSLLGPSLELCAKQAKWINQRNPVLISQICMYSPEESADFKAELEAEPQR